MSHTVLVSLFGWLSGWPLWALQVLGFGLGWVAFGASSTYRSRFIANWRQAGYPVYKAAGAIAQSGCIAAEMPRLWLGKDPRIEWRGLEHVQTAFGQGKGVLLLTPHLGGFEAIAHAYTQSLAAEHGDLTAMYRPARKPWLQDIVAQSRQRPGMATVPAGMGGIRQMLKCLKAGKAVIILPDQVPVLGTGVWADFFGKAAYTMTLATKLAQQSGCTIVPLRSERLRFGRGYRIHVQPALLGLTGDVQTDTQTISTAMQGLIRQCPQQYLWSYARYKAPSAMPEVATTVQLPATPAP